MTATQEASLVFIPNAAPAVPHACCELCEGEWPTSELKGITNEDDANRVSGLLEVDPDASMCPECRNALVKEARWTVCPRCHRPECPGPIIRTDVDQYDCPGRGFRNRF